MDSADTIQYELSEPSSVQTTISENLSIEEKVKAFIERETPKLYILTPCFGGVCYINYLTCLINTALKIVIYYY